MQLINLTPHAVVVTNNLGDSAPVTFAPSGMIARLAVQNIEKRQWNVTNEVGTVANLKFVINEMGEVIDLPAPIKNRAFIVSAMVRAAVPHRNDVFSPGDLVRDDAGRVIGCQNLVGNY
jgi:hypothetical protein